jgi:predicted glycosyltransferase
VVEQNKLKILIDIGHPAHVHYFKNFIKIMENKGHQFLIISRNKEIEHYLLKQYDIPFVDRGKGQKSLIGKTIYYFKAVHLIFKNATIFKPDVILSFGSPYAAIVSKLINKPYIAFDDTEHAKLEHLMYIPFTRNVLTPSCFTKALGRKQIRFNGYMELCYLHPNYFTPDPSILDLLGVKKDEKYVIMRFVSWEASHDIGHSGLSLEMKKKAVKELSKYARVFISSESELPEDLKPYQIKIPPERMHDALAFATLFVGESGTMSTECAVLGTPNIQIRHTLAPDKIPGVHLELVKRGLKVLKQSDDIDGIISMSRAILDNYQVVKNGMTKNRDKLLMDYSDVTDFMCWFVENYPTSKKLEYKEGCAESFG